MHSNRLRIALAAWGCFVVPLGIAAANANTAPPCGDYASHMRWLGRVAVHGFTFAVATRGDFAFVVGQGAGVDVVDLSNPYAPFVVTSLDIPDALWITIDQEYAYVSCESGVRIFDVSDASNPVAVGFAPLPYAGRITVRGRYAYVCAGAPGIQVLDVADPANPVAVGGLDTPGNPQGIAFVGSYACIADGRAGITIADCSDPASPQWVTTFATSGYAQQVASYGQTVAVADSDRRLLLLLDLSVPGEPEILGQTATPAVALDVAMDATQVVLADDRGVSVWDWSNPSHPAFTGRLEVGYEVHGLALLGHRVLLPETSFGLHVLDLPQPASVQPVASVAAVSTIWDAAVSGTHLLVAGDPTFHVVRMSADAPAIVATLPIRAMGVAATGSVAVLAGDQGFHVLDVTQPAAPARVGGIEALLAEDVECAGRYGYVVGTDFTVVDLAVPAEPRIVGVLPGIGGHTIRLRGHLAFIVGGGLRIVDISDPLAPVLVGQAAIAGRGLAIVGNHAYTTDRDAGLVAIDISDVHLPRLESTARAPNPAFDVAVESGIAYVASEQSGVQLYDLHDPVAPLPMGTIETSGLAFHVGLASGMLWAGNFDLGVDFLPLQCATTPVALESFDVSSSAGAARISWRAGVDNATLAQGATEPQLEFRLRRDGRDMPFAVAGARDYSAVDPWPAEDPASRTYTLFARRLGEPWLALAEREVQRFAPEPGAVRLAVTPNPSRGACTISFDTGNARAASLGIFTIDGRRVTNLRVPAAASGVAVAWNGRDSMGRVVPAGMYLVRLEVGSQLHTRKLVVTH